MRSARALAVACMLSAGVALPAHAADHRFLLLLDTDDNPTTGCTIATSRGPLTGVDQVWTTVVTTTPSGASIARIERQTCSAGSLGATIVFDSGGWPAGIGHGTSGVAALETFLPLSALPAQGTMKVVVASTNATGGQDATLPFALTLAPAAPPPGSEVQDVPVSPWLLLALAAVLGVTGAWWLSRHPQRSSLVVCVLIVAASSLVWAATVTLDGNVGDWNGVAPDTANALGSGPVDANIVAVFHQSDATRLYFRIDADVRADSTSNQSPIVSAGADQTITLPVGASLAGSASDDGLPNPPGALMLTWNMVSGPGTVTFGDVHAGVTSATFSQAGVYVLRLGASDGALAGSDDVQITVNAPGGNQNPVAQADSTSTSGGASTQVDVLANDTDANGDTLTVTSFTQGAHGSVACLPTGLCTYTPSGGFSGSDSFTYTVSDGHGGQASATVTIAVAAFDTTLSAPALKRGVTSVIGPATSFLYTGPDAVQTGVTPGAINETRAAVLRGKVTTRGGDVLPGATVSVLDHAEFGHTVTRGNGVYDLVVNGGGQLTVEYSAPGFLPLQKQVDVPWQAYATVPRVALIALDTAVTAMTTNAPNAQTHQASRITDSDGSRRIIVVVPAGTSATMTMPDGSTQPLTTLHVRATEYTVGPDGPSAMPANLPALTAYTYCVELSVDEALAAGAVGVTFSQPVVTYVENFLGFPAGTTVPVGGYDRAKGQWVPSPNGRIVRIVSVTAGLADVDTDGDNVADAGLGITQDERASLAASFAAGQTLWRVAVPHFSPSDSNWQWRTPDDAVAPGSNGAGPDPNEPLQDPQCSAGSIIECENQVLGESVRIVGTPYSLNYRSDRMPGLVASRTIRLSGGSVPGSLASIGLHLSVAGRDFQQTFPPSANLQTTFVWDRHDAYGRQLLGGQTLNVLIDYNYPTTYQDPGPLPAAFNSVGVSVGATPSRQQINLSQSFTTTIGEGLTDARTLGLGGWTLDVHHVYDPNARVAHLGNGARRRAASLARMLSTTDLPGQSILFDIAVGPDGAQYVALPHGDQIVRIAPDGSQSFYAGNGTEGFSGDGGPATLAKLGDPTGVALAPDGSLYIAEQSNFRVRKVSPQGIISTVAGTGVAGFSGDGGPATNAQLSFAERVAVGADATLYLLDGQRVRRVNNDGVIDTIAGNGTVGFTGDGGPATAASLNAASISVAADGSVFIADFGNNRVRRVDPNGVIHTVADYTGIQGRPVSVRPAADGSLLIGVEFAGARLPQVDLLRPDQTLITIAGGGASPIQSGVPATQVAIPAMRGVALAPDGALFIVMGDASSTVLRVAPALPGFEGTAYFIASADGSELYVFDEEGRHLRTLNALTGASLYEFGYDAGGLLDRITEKTGGTDNVTTIEHDANGNPTAIVGPFGQVTALAVDGNGFLASIANPAGEAFQIASDAGGLMSSFTDPRGKSSTFLFDSDGHLTSDTDAVGGSQTLVRATAGNTSTVSRTTALGRTTQFATQILGDNRQIRTITEPDGSDIQTDETIDAGSKRATSSDGSQTDYQSGPDPRFGMASPQMKSLTITLPSGLTFTASHSQSVVLGNPSDPLSLSSLTETSTLDGRTTTTHYTAATQSLVTTTPAGRQLSISTDAFGKLLSSAVSGLEPQAITYNGRGQLTSLTRGSGATLRTTSFTYNPQGYPQTISDPIGRTGLLAYDAAARIRNKTLPNGQVIAFDYDAAGNMVALTPPGRPVHTFTYSDRNELTAVTPPPVPGTGPTTFAYDLDGRLTGITRPDNRAIAFGYDAAGRLATRQLQTSGVTTATDTLTYDNAGRVAKYSAASGVDTTYAYDGTLLTGETWSGAIAGAVTRTYDSSLRLASYTIGGAGTFAFGYDADNFLTGAGELAITRDAQHALPVSSALGSVTTSTTYNGFGEIAGFAYASGGSALMSVAISRDALGRVVQKVETIGGVTDTFVYSYDAVGQLIAVGRNGTTIETYVYDVNGNRTSATTGGSTVTATYDDQDRITQYGSVVHAYNGAGDLASKASGGQTSSYQYDQLGNLVAVTLPNGTAISYLVDAKNRRVGKKINGSLVKGFLYADRLRPVAELDGAGAVSAEFLYVGSNVPAYMVKAGVKFRILTDAIGSVRLVVDATTGAIAQRMDYDGFGNVLQDTNPGFQPFGFAGGLYDPDTQLVRFGSRDYDAGTGRWTAKDLMGFMGNDTNLYRYVNNDPVNLVDPAGLGTLANALVGVAAGLYDVFTLRILSPPPPPPVLGPDGKPLLRFQMQTGNLVTDIANLINGFMDETVVDTSSLAYVGGDICGSLVAGGGAAAGGRSLLAADAAAEAELAALKAKNAARLAEAAAKQIDFVGNSVMAAEARAADAAAAAAQRAADAAKRALGNMSSTGWQTGGGGPIGGIGGGGGH